MQNMSTDLCLDVFGNSPDLLLITFLVREQSLDDCLIGPTSYTSPTFLQSEFYESLSDINRVW